MPYSDASFDDLTRTLARQIRLSTCLDIGAGEGKYGKIVREFHPHAEFIGIEIESDYIERFGLDKMYNSIWCMPADEIFEKKVDISYDLVIIGSWEGYRHEAHISFWGKDDFAELDYLLFRRNSTGGCTTVL